MSSFSNTIDYQISMWNRFWCVLCLKFLVRDTNSTFLFIWPVIINLEVAIEFHVGMALMFQLIL